MPNMIQAKGVSKVYGKSFALNNVSFELGAGRIMGLIGPNGAGKTTALRCLMGMATCHGELNVLGKDPRHQRVDILQDVAYIADTAILPNWMRVDQLLEYSAAVHPKFDLDKANQFLSQTQVSPHSTISTLSKGMVTQVHLALAISVDAKLMVLDEPTLGLDILYRKRFYEQLLHDYFDENRTVLITTHQVEEIEHILTDLLFIKNGQVQLNIEMDSVAEQFCELHVSAEKLAEAQVHKPIHTRTGLGGHILLFEDITAQQREALQTIGPISTPSVADLFVAKMV